MKHVCLTLSVLLCTAALLLCAGCDKGTKSKTTETDGTGTTVSAGGTTVKSGNGETKSGNGNGKNGSAWEEFDNVEDEAIAVAKALHAADERGGLTVDSDEDENDADSVHAPTTPAGAQSSGTVQIEGAACKAYTVSDGEGHTEQLAHGKDGQWYYKDSYGDYIPVTLMDDGTLTVGELPLDGGSVLDMAEWMLKEFTQDSTCTVEQSGNGLVNGVDCDFYVATDKSGNVLGAVAHGPDGEYYYREKTGFLYRLIGRQLGDYWLAEPVSEYEKAALLVYKEVSGKTADKAKSTETIIINDKNATQYAILKGDKTVARIAVTLDNRWYYDEGAKGSYHRVMWSESGVSLS